MKPDCPVIHASEWEVHDVPLAVCQRMVAAHHYAGGGANTGTFCHGLFPRGALECCGIAWWLPPTKGAARASWDGDWQQVLMLSRLSIVPDMPQNAATFLLSRSRQRIWASGRFPCLITYADTWRNHWGGIYRADNWECMGMTKPEAVWVDLNGRMVARKAGPKTRTAAEMRALGFEEIGRFAKRKFRRIDPEPRRGWAGETEKRNRILEFPSGAILV